MIIEKIGVDAPVATYGLDETYSPVEPTGVEAKTVVAWYNFSVRPGTKGNAVYGGHVTWNGSAVFKNLHKLAAGDLVKLRDERGAEVVYRVTSNQLIDPSVPDASKVILPTEENVITIFTCGGDFVDTNDPVFGGEYTHRLIIRAELVSVTPVA
jgi:LPXTG-site transpeptidase (sortase) family protein